MGIHARSFDRAYVQANAERLAGNSYPGNGIVMGNSADGRQFIEAYWIMGKSVAERNRILTRGENTIETLYYDPKGQDSPSQLVRRNMTEDVSATNGRFKPTQLYPVANGSHGDLVTGRGTRPSYRNDGFEECFRKTLVRFGYQDEYQNRRYTPSITGMLAIRGAVPIERYYYSIIKTNPDTDRPEYNFGQGYLEEDMPNGAGICFHTYQGDGDPPPPFEGSPYVVPLEATADETAEALWTKLDRINRVALAVKAINKMTGEVSVSIVNRLAA